MHEYLELLHKHLNVYYGVLLVLGAGFLWMSLTSEPLQVFSNEQIANASLVLICFGLASLFVNNLLSNLGAQIDTSGGRPTWLARIGRWPWTAIVFLVHAGLLATPMYLVYGILY